MTTKLIASLVLTALAVVAQTVITPLQGTDLLKNSYQVINNNFNSLNSNKLEKTADPGVALVLYNFSVTNGAGVTGTLAVAGGNTVTFTTCPLGVAGTNTYHYVYISGGTGTAEAVLITGGTCTSGSANGTLSFTTANTHTGAWVISSATSGTQEAIAVAGTTGKVSLPCYSIDIYAPITIRKRVSLVGCGQEVSFINNKSTTTGAIRYIGGLQPAGESQFGGNTISGLTIYAGTKDSVAYDTNSAAGIYVLDGDIHTNLNHITVRNHAKSIHIVNGWFVRMSYIIASYHKDDGILVEEDNNLGTGSGADVYMDNVNARNTRGTGSRTANSCGIRFAKWSGIYLDQITTNSEYRGICFWPRAPYGIESYSHNYYGSISNTYVDGSQEYGLYFDSTYGGVSFLKFSNIIVGYTGCIDDGLHQCVTNPFDLPSNGIYMNSPGTNPIRDIDFMNSGVQQSGGHGISINGEYTTQIHFINVNSDASSLAATNTYDGFYIGNKVSGITINGGYSGHLNSTILRYPRYGITLDGTATPANWNSGIMIQGHNFLSSNVSGSLNNTGTALLDNVFANNTPSTDSKINRATYANTYLAIVPQTGPYAYGAGIDRNDSTDAYALIRRSAVIGGKPMYTMDTVRDNLTDAGSLLISMNNPSGTLIPLGGWRGKTSHFEPPSLQYSSLQPAVNQTAIVYCYDCDTPATPGAACTSAGDKLGAEAHFIRGAWKCF